MTNKDKDILRAKMLEAFTGLFNVEISFIEYMANGKKSIPVKDVVNFLEEQKIAFAKGFLEEWKKDADKEKEAEKV